MTTELTFALQGNSLLLTDAFGSTVRWTRVR
jgi:hypothetical protein